MKAAWLLLPFAILAVGCAPDPMIGRWKSSTAQSATTIEFQPGGKFAMDIELTAVGQGETARATGQYAMDKDKLTWVPETAEVKGAKAQKDLKPENVKSVVAQMSGSVCAISGDKLTLKLASGDRVYDRIK